MTDKSERDDDDEPACVSQDGREDDCTADETMELAII